MGSHRREPSNAVMALYSIHLERLELTASTSMSFKRNRRKPDLFSVLLIALALGMSITLAYQINVYYGASAVPIAKGVLPGQRPGG